MKDLVKALLANTRSLPELTDVYLEYSTEVATTPYCVIEMQEEIDSTEFSGHDGRIVSKSVAFNTFANTATEALKITDAIKKRYFHNNIELEFNYVMLSTIIDEFLDKDEMYATGKEVFQSVVVFSFMIHEDLS